MKVINIKTAVVIIGLFLSLGIVSAYYDTQALERLERQRQEQTQEQTLQRKMPSRGEMTSLEAIRERAREHQELFAAERQTIIQQAQERRQEYALRVQDMKQKRLMEIEQKQREFREKLAQIREERHRQLAERLSVNINLVNQLRSDAALRYLDALKLVLDKIEARTNIIENTRAVDLTQVKNEIAQARQKIEEAKTLILAQKSKEYIISIQSQETLGQDIRNTMQELRNNHQLLRQEVLHSLRNLIHAVAQQLKTAVQGTVQDAEEALNEEF